MFKVVLCILLIVAGFIARAVFKSKVKEQTDEMENKMKEYDKNDQYARHHLDDYLDDAKSKISLYKKLSHFVLIGCIIGAVVIFVLGAIAIVPTGYTGIKTTFGKVENDVLASGFNFVMPWQNVVTMDNREQKNPFTLEAFSKDIQQVDVQGSINLNIDKTTAMNLYKDVGVNYMSILVQPRVLEDVKIIIAQYTAENLIENRQRASDAIYALVKEELASKGINVISFAIENIDFTDAFEAAVEAKQVATQQKQKAQTEQEQLTMEMQKKADRDRIQAQAAADVQKIDADARAYAVKVQAEAQAEANKEIAATLSESLIKYNMIQQWNGKLPTVMSGEGSSSIIDLRTITEEE